MENGNDVHTWFKSGRKVNPEIHEKRRNSFSLPEISARNPLLPFSSCVIHRSGKQFVCIYGKCPDYSACFRDEPEIKSEIYHALKFHPDDRKIWNEKIFPDIIRFAESLSLLDYQDYRFSFNHRYILPNGRISQFIHEGTLSVRIGNRLPFLKLQEFIEIGDFKLDDSMILSIFRHSYDWGYQKIFSKVYTDHQDSALTDRELEIVRLCQEGLSGKMIADKLQLSIHTVKNHKRKSMSKTSTHNITELIHVCFQNHWL